jgi:uncharacterized membrane protein YgcG
MRIQVGYGLTSVLTDAVSKQIFDQELKPHFEKGDFDGGFTAGVDSILKIIGGQSSHIRKRSDGRRVENRNCIVLSRAVLKFVRPMNDSTARNEVIEILTLDIKPGRREEFTAYMSRRRYRS